MQLQSHDTLDYTVYQKVKDQIIQKVLKPGELLVQSQLSQSLGVSRTPLRRALAQLEKEGLLESSPKGWYVKKFTRRDIISVFRIRAVLEGLAARLAANRIDTPALAFMKTMFEEAYRGVRHQQYEDYYQADKKFHAMITEAAGDALLSQTVQSNRIIYNSQIQGLYRDPAETYPEHMEIIAALERRDGSAAERRMREHIEKAIPILESGELRIYK